MKFSTLTFEYASGIAHICMNRPDRLNALGPETLDELITILDHCGELSDLQVLHVTAAGPSFSVGFDLRAFSGILVNPDGDRKRLKKEVERGAKVIERLRGINAVTIASMRGHAIGGGFLIAAACDLRIAAENTVLAIPEVDIGIPLLWGGIPLLSTELGMPLARDLVMTARRFNPHDLAGTGFFHRVVPSEELETHSQTLVSQLIDKPPAALRLTKMQFRAASAPRAQPIGSDADLFFEAISHQSFFPAAMRYLQRIYDDDEEEA